jgi:hypothetical protein
MRLNRPPGCGAAPVAVLRRFGEEYDLARRALFLNSGVTYCLRPASRRRPFAERNSLRRRLLAPRRTRRDIIEEITGRKM